MSNFQVGVPLVGTRMATGDLRKRADTRPAPTRHKAGCFVAQGFIPAKLRAEFRMLYAVCLNLDIDHSLLDIGYSSFFWIGFESIALADFPSETQPRIPCFSFFCRMPFEKKFDRHC